MLASQQPVVKKAKGAGGWPGSRRRYPPAPTDRMARVDVGPDVDDGHDGLAGPVLRTFS